MVRPAEYSRDCLKTLRAATGIEYAKAAVGNATTLPHAQQYENATRDIAVLEDAGVPYQPRIQPTGEVGTALAEVAYQPADCAYRMMKTGDCQLFTQRLARMAEQAGVTFRFNTPVEKYQPYENDQIYGVKCADEIIKADAYMLWRLIVFDGDKGIADIPVYPLKGPLTIPTVD
ncbi:hypothetical protein KCP74_16855 [Salmonella enterica subsp. enterica]|nr:hypothetical protein KCP74_16855 [Salmonella enterica subsp. enterica]